MVAPSLETLDRIAAPGAAFVAAMDRAEGAYHLEVRRVGTSTFAAPTRDEVLSLVPPGSRWTEALGWSAYFGWPLEAAGRHYWAVGGEEVRRSAGGDGGGASAYPAVRVYLHLTPPSTVLAALAAALDSAGAGGGAPDPTPAGAVTVFPLAGGTAQASRVEQAAILRRAAAACARGGRPLFRTAALAEGEALPLAGFPMRLPRGVDRALLGVPEALCRFWAAPARAVLYLRGFWRPR